MSDFYGVNATLKRNVPEEKVEVQQERGRMRVLHDTYTFAAIIDTTDSLYMMKIPKGARVFDCEISSDDLGSTGDINVGWEASAISGEDADADGFYAALDVNAAAVSRTHMVSSVGGFQKKFTEEVQVVIVPTEITTATSGDIKLTLYYTLD